MSAIPRAYVEGYTGAINSVSEAVRTELAAALSQIDMGRDVATVRAEVVEVMQAYCGGASDLAAQLAAEFYDGLREWELGERMGAVAASGREPAATEGAVRAFAEKLVDGDAEAFVNLCLDRMDYETKVSAAKCVVTNGERDRRHPKYARVPTGAETCDFCIMLASRGFVYSSEELASHAHAHCDCRVVPSWKAREVEGYDPDAYYDQWKESGFKASSGGGRSIAVRRESESSAMPDEQAHKLAQRLLRGTSRLDRDEALRRIVEADIEWKESKHSADEDNYFNGRIRRLMTEHAISLQEIDQWTQYYLK